MNKMETFDQFLATSSANISLYEFGLNIVLAIFLAIILEILFRYCSSTYSNRSAFTKNFILLALATLIVITIVKSSLALSLGLVGALSIVRFRTAIKNPEELNYLFLCIVIGLGLGANQRYITVIGFLFVALVIVIKFYFSKTNTIDSNLYLSVSYKDGDEILDQRIIDTVMKHAPSVHIKRIETVGNQSELFIEASFPQHKDVLALKHELRSLNNSINLSFIESKGII